MELPKKLFVVEIELGKPKIKKDTAGDFTKEELEAIVRRYNSHDALLAACKDVRVELAVLHRIIVDPPRLAKDPAVRKPLVDKIEKRQKQVKDAIAEAQPNEKRISHQPKANEKWR